MIVVYGISNCDTVKKARAWLGEHGVHYKFHDFKKLGVPEEQMDRWFVQLGWETLVNRQGTTWRQLDASLQATVKDASAAKALMQAHPSVVKRPVVDWGPRITVGFDLAVWTLLQSRQSGAFTDALPIRPHRDRGFA